MRAGAVPGACKGALWVQHVQGHTIASRQQAVHALAGRTALSNMQQQQQQPAPHLHGFAQALLADAAQADELEAVGGGQQVLRHRHLQLGALG